MQPDEILARMEAVRFKGFNSYDSKELSEITQIRKGFLEFAEKFGTSHNVVVVNASQSYENVSLEILTKIKEIFNIA
jgi:thymidylate kinase